MNLFDEGQHGAGMLVIAHQSAESCIMQGVCFTGGEVGYDNQKQG